MSSNLNDRAASRPYVADWRSVERGLVNAGVDRSQLKPVLAYLEQCAKRESNLEALRAVRDYRRRIEAAQPR